MTSLTTYTPHRPFMAHQAEAFRRSAEAPAFALFMEQGTGKTKVLIDTARYLYQTGKIDAVVVFADNGIHRNWVNEEWPQEWPMSEVVTRADGMPGSLTFVIWEAGRARSKKVQDTLTEIVTYPDGSLVVVAMNIESVITEPAKEFLRKFLRRYRTMVVVDESTSIKTPGALRTKTMRAIGKLAVVRRIATGTPMAESPFHIYAPFQFLGTNLLGFGSFFAFKNYFGRFITRQLGHGGRSFLQLDKNEDGSPAYVNLEELKRRIAPYSYTVSKEECLDLPPKTYQKFPFTLTPKLRGMYERLREEYLLEIAGQDRPITLTLTRMLRLQQLTCGLKPRGDSPEEGMELLEDNPRLDAFARLMEQLPANAQCLVWCRYRPDVTRVMGWAEANGISAVRYDGMVGDDDREANKIAFQAGKARLFVGTQKAGGKGLTLNQASYAIYYSNDYPLEPRLQSEDRCHRKGQTKAVTYIDLVCEDTTDRDIVAALRAKKELSDYMSDRPCKEWL